MLVLVLLTFASVVTATGEQTMLLCPTADCADCVVKAVGLFMNSRINVTGTLDNETYTALLFIVYGIDVELVALDDTQHVASLNCQFGTCCPTDLYILDTEFPAVLFVGNYTNITTTTTTTESPTSTTTEETSTTTANITTTTPSSNSTTAATTTPSVDSSTTTGAIAATTSTVPETTTAAQAATTSAQQGLATTTIGLVENGLTAGQVAGIVIGVLVAVAFCVLLLVLVLRRRRRAKYGRI